MNEALDVLEYFEQLKTKNNDIVDKKINELVENSKIDKELNQSQVEKIETLKNYIQKNTSLKILIVLIVFSLIGIVVLFCLKYAEAAIAVLFVSLIFVCLICVNIANKNKNKKHIQEKYKINDASKKNIEKLIDLEIKDCYKKMEKINSKINMSTFFNLITETFSDLVFDGSITNFYNENWNNGEKNSCTLYCGMQLFKNPSLLTKKIYEIWYMQTYTGVATYMKGKRYESKTVTITLPAVKYEKSTTFSLKNDVTGDLVFSTLKKGKNPHMENPKFDKIFKCYRNDEIKFKTLFTILAQEQIVKIKDQYDFDMWMEKNICTVKGEKDSEINFSPFFIYDYDLKQLTKKFKSQNKKLFQNLYTLILPLLAIPVFHHFGKTNKNIKKSDESYEYWEFIFNNCFDLWLIRHPSSNLEDIIKINNIKKISSTCKLITITCHGINKVHETRHVQGASISVFNYLKVSKKNHFLVYDLSKNYDEIISTNNATLLKKIQDNFSKHIIQCAFFNKQLILQVSDHTVRLKIDIKKLIKLI